MMFESLASLTVGNPLISRRLNDEPIHPGTQNSVLAAVDLGFFGDVDDYRREVDKLVDAVKGLPTADGFDEILVPGEPEDRVYAQRKRDGIPLPQGTVENLRAVASRLEIALPEALA